MGVVSNKTDITELQKSGGGGDLEPRVRALELEDITLAEGLALVQTSVSRGAEALALVQTSVNSLKATVGDSSSGLVKDLSDLADVVGDSSSGLVKSVSDLSTAVTGKADKVSSATNGDFAGLDSNGNITDSGKKPSDYMLTATYDSTAAVATAGGIVAYINDTVAAALSASY